MCDHNDPIQVQDFGLFLKTERYLFLTFILCRVVMGVLSLQYLKLGEVSNTITGPQGQITPNYVSEGGQGPLGGHRIKTVNWQADGDH